MAENAVAEVFASVGVIVCAVMLITADCAYHFSVEGVRLGIGAETASCAVGIDMQALLIVTGVAFVVISSEDVLMLTVVGISADSADAVVIRGVSRVVLPFRTMSAVSVDIGAGLIMPFSAV